mgnify:CR=1 FL=1
MVAKATHWSSAHTKRPGTSPAMIDSNSVAMRLLSPTRARAAQCSHPPARRVVVYPWRRLTHDRTDDRGNRP